MYIEITENLQRTTNSTVSSTFVDISLKLYSEDGDYKKQCFDDKINK